MQAFHNDPAIKAMTPDQMCLLALSEELITVIPDDGTAYSKRFWGKKLGCENKSGYIVFTLHCAGFRKQIKMHRLIWLSVYGVIPEGLVPDHKNRCRSDNRITNLRLLTHQGNSLNRRSYLREGNPAARLDQKTVDRIRQEYLQVKSYGKLAERFGVSRSLVAQIIRRELWV